MSIETEPLRLGRADRGRALTDEEFAEAVYEEPWRYELIGGRLIVMAPDGEEHDDASEPWRDRLGAFRLANPDLVDKVVSEAWVLVATGRQRIGDIGWMVHRQGILYNQQFGWNGDFEALIAGIYSQYHAAPTTPAKDLWVAEQRGQIVGSIFVMPSEGLPGSAQLRMLYVEPAARGQGVGAALVKQAVSFAQANGYERMRLWTHTIQQSARRIYAAAGFKVVETIEEDNFGKAMTGEIWEIRF